MGDNLNGIFANMIQGMGFIGCAPNRVYNMAPPDGGGVEATAEGTELTLHSAAAPLTALTLYGKSEQETTTGAQLYDSNLSEDNKYQNCDVENSNFAITNNEQFWITGKIPIKPSTQYIITPATISYGAYYEDIDTPIKTTQIISNVFTAPENANYVCISYKKTVVAYGTNIMLNSGSTALPWEPYTGGAPSPSPGYPQEIKSVGDSGEIKVDVCGGNLIDYCAAVPNATGAIRYDKERLYYSRDNHTPAIAVQGGATWVLNLKKGEIYINGSSLFPLRIYKGNVFDIGYNSANRIYSNGGNASSYKVQIPQDGTYTIGVWIDAQDIEGYLDWLNVNYIPNQTGISNYEPIQTLPVQTPNGLPGIPVDSGGNYTDADGQQWICDEVDFERGVYVQRVHVINAKNRSWNDSWNLVFPDETGKTHVFNVSTKEYANSHHAMSNVFFNRDIANSANVNVFTTNQGNGGIGVRVYSQLASTLEEWNAYINSHDVIFVLVQKEQNYVETPLSPSDLAAYSALRTYSPTTVVSNNAGAWMKVGYKATPQPMTMLARKR